MSHRTAVWPPYAGIIRATGSRHRGPLPPVCPPPGNHGRKPTSAPPCGPRIPPASGSSPLFPPRWITSPPSSHEYASHEAQAVLKFHMGWNRGSVQHRFCVGYAPQKLFFVTGVWRIL
jgi:hypothetical protein